MNLKNKDRIEHIPNKVSDNPLVSVIVTTYNHENFIEQCLDSILMQKTNFEFEIIVGEDDSSDETRNICKKYAKNYPDKIRLILHDRRNVISINGSLTGRYNFLYSLEKSNGKYISLCDGDDYWIDPFKLQKQADFLEKNTEFAACYHGCKFVDENNETVKDSKSKNYSDFTAKQLISTQGELITNTVMFLNKIKGFPNHFINIPSGDSIIWHLLGFYGGAKYISTIEQSAYRVHSGGIWSNMNYFKRLDNSILTLTAIRQNIINQFGKESEYIQAVNKKIVENFINYFYQQIYHGRIKYYFLGYKLIFKTKGINSMFIIKEHLIDLFKRVFNKK